MHDLSRFVVVSFLLAFVPTPTQAASETSLVGDQSGAPESALMLAASQGERSFVLIKSLGQLRNDFSGLSGMRFTVGSQSLVVSALGRHISATNSRTHLLKLVRASTGADVQGGNILLPTSGGTVGQFKYATLPSPVTLLSNTVYYLVSEELAGGDTFYDIDTTVMTESAAVITSGVYREPGKGYTNIDTAGHTYGPVDFRYTTAAPTRPVVVITAPTSGSSFNAPTNLALAVTTSGDVTNVEFVVNGVRLGADATAPFNFTWVNPMVGNYSLVARVRASSGLMATSSMVNISIKASPPMVAITNPVAGASFEVPAAIPLEVAVGGSISEVEYFANGTTIGRQTNAPFDFTWTTAAAGNYELIARATAQGGLIATSSPVAISVTAPQIPSVPFVTDTRPMLLRSNFTGFVGMVVTVGDRSLVVTRLGRMMVEGNTGSHVVKLVRASSSQDVPGASVTLSMLGGVEGQFLFGTLPMPVVLEPHATYYLISTEEEGADYWFDLERTMVTTTDVATVDAGVYKAQGQPFFVGGVPGHSYGPLNFEYLRVDGSPPVTVQLTEPASSTFDEPASLTLRAAVSAGVTNVDFFANDSILGSASSDPFTFVWQNPPQGDYELSARARAASGLMAVSARVPISITTNVSGQETAFVAQNEPRILRNDFNGFLGFVFTVGSNSVTVTRLGRYVVPGNGQTHRLKLVGAIDNQDIPGSLVTVNLAGAVPERFKYALLPSPLVLPARTTYYLVSEEISAGDQWYDGDRTKIKTTSVGTSDAGVFGQNGQWIVGGLAGHSYGPVDFKYLAAAGLPEVMVAMTKPADGAAFVSPSNVVLESITSPGVELVEYFRNGTKVGQASAAPFRFTWNSPALGEFTFLAVATAGNGLTATSSVVHVAITTNISGVEESFVLTKDPKQPRNDYTGFLGLTLRVGTSPINVTRLGRLFIAGNNGRHLLKLVRAETGEDVPGGSIELSLAAGGVPGEFVYATLPAAVRLNAFTEYYLVSGETADGDQWYDLERTSISTTTVADAEAGIYQDELEWVVGGLPDHSYGPLDFKYLVEAEAPLLLPQLFNGQLRLSLLGVPGSTYAVESSGDFQQWTEIGRYATPFGNATLDVALSGEKRFFRARVVD